MNKLNQFCTLFAPLGGSKIAQPLELILIRRGCDLGEEGCPTSGLRRRHCDHQWLVVRSMNLCELIKSIITIR